MLIMFAGKYIDDLMRKCSIAVMNQRQWGIMMIFVNHDGIGKEGKEDSKRERKKNNDNNSGWFVLNEKR